MSDRIPPPPASGSPGEWERAARVLAGEASPDEIDAVRRWIAEDPTRARVFAALEPGLEALRRERPAPDVEAALRRVHERMREPALHVLAGAVAGSSVRPAWRVPLRIAAALALLLGGALLARHALLQHEASAPVAAVVAHTYLAATGHIDSVRLADGTRVLLAPGTRLQVPADFAMRRRVALNGEALFEVQHDATRPFVVRVGDVSVEDIGTSFDIRGDAGERVRVVVTRGSVRVRPAPGDSGLVLHADQAAVVPPGGAAHIERDSARSDDLAWTHGQLVFRHAPISEIAAALRRWYGIDLEVPDPVLTSQHLTTSFDATDSRAHVLRVIALALGADAQVRGDTVILTSGANR